MTYRAIESEKCLMRYSGESGVFEESCGQRQTQVDAVERQS